MRYLILFFLAALLIGGCGKKNELEVKKTETAKTETPVQEQSKQEKEVIISTKEVSSYIGKAATIKGYVADVVVREKVAYLNFDAKYPKNSFSAVVFPSDYKKFGNLEDFKNKNVEVKGMVTTYNNKAQIILNSSEQIKITKE